jgi:hypothetical protein
MTVVSTLQDFYHLPNIIAQLQLDGRILGEFTVNFGFSNGGSSITQPILGIYFIENSS